MAPRFLLHHSPRSRSERALWLLEEAGASYELIRHDLEKGTNKAPDFLRLNPLGKLPVLVDRGPDGSWQSVVTESLAICGYIADALPEAGLAPAIGTPERAAYASWLAYGATVLEPAFADAVFPRAAAAPARALGWPPLDAVLAQLEAALTPGPYLLGDRFTAADVMVGSMLQWGVGWGKIAPTPAIARTLAALEARPALARARAAA
ncbi:glutathione S-transferase family protein [Rhodovarius crocodyli]|uniref:Glutathione S-transferase family protein n=1 Tax=Rhodovarius crocodyli TaxID=1979269 RepID=A0A437MCX1_9PROT|nr:glutathione S-transferase family protein [Rhodovarius crocodyli]RVT95468.1 glutathione S-transferase family protein [Rhodovarius crocodyli]